MSQKGVVPNKLNGKCPYPCTDPRCRAYQFGTYCGPGPTTIIKNPNNPYDSAGYYHNVGVATLVLEISSPSVSTIIQDTKDYAASVNLDTSYYDGWYDTATTMYNYYSIIESAYAEDPNSLDTLLYNDGFISSTDVMYLNSINNAVDDVITDATAPTPALYNEIANNIVSIENTIINDTTLSSNEKMGLLEVAAINRYSGAYWANYINDWVTVNNHGVSPLFLKHFTWRKLWHADASGALGGAIGTITLFKGLQVIQVKGFLVIAGAAIIGGIGSSVGWLFFGS